MKSKNYLSGSFVFIVFIVFSISISCNKPLDLSENSEALVNTGETTSTSSSDKTKTTSKKNTSSSSKKDKVSDVSGDDDDNDNENNNENNNGTKESNNSSSSSNKEETVNIVTGYKVTSSWYETSYGGYKKVSALTMNVTDNSMKSHYKRESIVCTTGYAHAGEVIKHVSSEEENTFERTKLVTLRSYETTNYKKGMETLLFVNNVSSSDNLKNSYSYTFSKPIPVFPKDYLTKSEYEKVSDTVYSYSYSFYDSYVFKKDISAVMKVKFSVQNATRVVVTFTNNFVGETDSKRLAQLYGIFPILKETKYTINLNNNRISSLSGNGETLVSKESGNAKYTHGNVAPISVEGKICSYKNGNSSTKTYNCE